MPPTALKARTGELTPPGKQRARPLEQRPSDAVVCRRRDRSAYQLPRLRTLVDRRRRRSLASSPSSSSPRPRRPRPRRRASSPRSSSARVCCLGARRGHLGRDLVLALFLLGQALHRHHLLALLEPDEAHALGVAADGGDAVDRHADELAAVGDQHQVVVVGDDAQADHLAVALGGLDGDDALAAAVLGRVVRGRACACRSRARTRSAAWPARSRGTTAMPTTWSSSSRSLMPRTPRAVAAHRAHVLLRKRIAQPSRVPSSRSTSPSVMRTPTRASSSSMDSAMMPLGADVAEGLQRGLLDHAPLRWP